MIRKVIFPALGDVSCGTSLLERLTIVSAQSFGTGREYETFVAPAVM